MSKPGLGIICRTCQKSPVECECDDGSFSTTEKIVIVIILMIVGFIVARVTRS
jgi:hypothetical protein